MRSLLPLLVIILIVGGLSESLDSIQDAQEEINKAEVKIKEAQEDGKKVRLSEQTLAQAKSELEKAKQALKEGDIDKANELAEHSKDLAESRIK